MPRAPDTTMKKLKLNPLQIREEVVKLRSQHEKVQSLLD